MMDDRDILMDALKFHGHRCWANSQAVELGIENPHLRRQSAIVNQNTLIYVLTLAPAQTAGAVQVSTCARYNACGRKRSNWHTRPQCLARRAPEPRPRRLNQPTDVL